MPGAGKLTRRVGLVVVGVAALAAGVWCCRGLFVHKATAQQNPGPATAAEPQATAPAGGGGAATDYTSRVVAFIHNNEPVTRQELGEYLILRHGADKLPLLINKRLVDEECRRRGVTVSAAEVDAALAEDVKAMGTGMDGFVKTVLTRYKKSLFEWKEDILRPRLQMTRLVSSRITITPQELAKSFEASFGEKVECRVIMWPHDQLKKASEEYGKLRDSEPAFAEKARQQKDGTLASTGGKIRPIARHMMAPEIEKAAFELQPGQCSALINTREGIMMLRCDRRIPADTTVNRETVRPKLEKEIRDGKMQAEMATLFQSLREQARWDPRAPQMLKQPKKMPTGPMPPPSQVVAYLHGMAPVTREELGEFLIARYGAEKIEFLVNHKIIEKECAARNITVSDEDVDKGVEADLKMLNCDMKHFEKDFLTKWGKNLFEWREDVVKAKLLLTRLCEGRVKVTDEDVKKGFEAYYGERLACRIILFPPEQKNYAGEVYAKIRDSEAEFDRMARAQPSSMLASRGGRIDLFGRHVLGDENLEREAFKLQPGEISTLIETPQGYVVIKCDQRHAPDKRVKLEQVREKLTREAHNKKVQVEMQTVFKDLRQKANPRFILKSGSKPEDLLSESKRLLSETSGGTR